KSVNVGADLHDTAADKHREKITDNRAHIFGLVSEGKLQAPKKLEHHGELHGDLQGAADDRSPRGDDHERILRAAGTKGDHAGDHGDVPENRGRVGKEEFAVAVQDTKAPGGADEQARAGKEYAHKENGELALFTMEAGGDGVNQPRGGENAEKHKHRSAEGEKRGDGASGLARFFFIVAGQQTRINRNEGSGKHAFAK